MNEQYAVEPAAFATWQEVRYIAEKFGFFEGRFLAAFPGAWTRLVYEHFADASAMDKKRVEQLLQGLRQAGGLVRLGAQYDSSAPWISNLIERHGVVPFAGVVRGRTTRAPFPSMDELEAAEFFKPSRDCEIEATAEAYAQVAGPLVLSSSEIAIVDPYFKLHDENRTRVVKALIDLVSGSGKRLRIRIFAQARKSAYDDSEGFDAMEALARIRGRDQRVEYSLLDDSTTTEKMHARYLISAKGALRFEHGFQVLPRRKVDISVVDRVVHARLCRRFLHGEHGCEVVALLEAG